MTRSTNPSPPTAYQRILKTSHQPLQKLFFWLWNFWPPFFGAGIWIKSVSSDQKEVIVVLKSRPWTKNLIGTQYGGSMFSMTDPFLMTMLTLHLGESYRVVDKAAAIAFLRLGKGELSARFQITDADLQFIRQQLQQQEKIDWQTKIEIKDGDGQVVAVVDKVINIKNRNYGKTSN